MGFVDYFVFRSRVASLRRANEALISRLESATAPTRIDPVPTQPAPRPVPAVEPLFANSMPQTQVVTTGSPEFEAVKTRIGEVMAQNVVLQTKLRETEGLRARLRELEPAIHAARSNMAELESLRQMNASAQAKVAELQAGLAVALQQNQVLSGQVAAVRQAMAPLAAVAPTGEPAQSFRSAARDTHVDRNSNPTSTPTDESVGHHKPSEGQVATTLVASPPEAPAAVGDRPASPPSLKITHVVPQRDVMGRQMLTRIEGLTALHQAKLFAAGIESFNDICQTSPARLREIVQMDARDPVDTEAWVRQAAQIAYGLF